MTPESWADLVEAEVNKRLGGKFRIIHTECCFTPIRWGSPKLPNYCPECGSYIYDLAKGWVTNDELAALRARRSKPTGPVKTYEVVGVITLAEPFSYVIQAASGEEAMTFAMDRAFNAQADKSAIQHIRIDQVRQEKPL